MDIRTELPRLLPKAIAWAEAQAAWVANSGRTLDNSEVQLTRRLGIAQSERVRVALVEALPLPADLELHMPAVQTGLLGPRMVGLTLGYSVFICCGHETNRLLSHEPRHVQQYERAGSIANFLPGYSKQIVEFGYEGSPLEQDAHDHEVTDP